MEYPTHSLAHTHTHTYSHSHIDRQTDRPTDRTLNILFDNYVFIMYAFFTKTTTRTSKKYPLYECITIKSNDKQEQQQQQTE